MNKIYYTLMLAASLLFIQKTALAADRYWVRGSGNCNNSAKWSSVSGGQGGTSFPSSSDNVFFDNLSFTAFSQEVIISSTAYCNNISIATDVISFTLSGNQSSLLEINGDVNFNGYFFNNFYGTLQFASSGTKSINFSNYFPKGDVVFNGII